LCAKYSIFEKSKECIALAFFIHEKILEYSKCAYIKNNSDLASTIKFGRFHLNYLLYKHYVGNVGIELNKKIKCGIINLTNDIFLADFLLNENLPSKRKVNLLSYFKSKESLSKINEVFKIFNKVKNIVDEITKIYKVDNFNIIEFCQEDMIFEIESIEININSNGSISIYKRFIYDSYEVYKDQNKELEKEEERFKKVLHKQFKKSPECEEGTNIGCPAFDILVGYFDIEFDMNFVKKFVEVSY
jgi:hypothetical protein